MKQTVINAINDVLSGKIIISSDGVARYSANGCVVMDDVAELLEQCGLSEFSRYSTEQAKRAELREKFGY